jgi:hypothetical protein
MDSIRNPGFDEKTSSFTSGEAARFWIFVNTRALEFDYFYFKKHTVHGVLEKMYIFCSHYTIWMPLPR